MPFSLSNGMLGLAPNTMEPGDKVFIIIGCETPIILRDAGHGEYRIIGDAYVYGVMDGELVEHDPEIETIVIV